MPYKPKRKTRRRIKEQAHYMEHLGAGNTRVAALLALVFISGFVAGGITCLVI